MVDLDKAIFPFNDFEMQIFNSRYRVMQFISDSRDCILILTSSLLMKHTLEAVVTVSTLAIKGYFSANIEYYILKQSLFHWLELICRHFF